MGDVKRNRIGFAEPPREDTRRGGVREVVGGKLDAMGTPLGLTEDDVQCTIPLVLMQTTRGFVCMSAWGGSNASTLEGALEGMAAFLRLAAERQREERDAAQSAGSVMVPGVEGVN